MNKGDLDRIRTTNEGDYIALVFAARLYTELKESGEDDATDSCGDYVHKDEIYKRTYVDANGNVCCCECDSIIKGGFVEW